MNIGAVLKKLRHERSMTQEQLAEYLNVSTQAVSKWENGLSYPDITLIPVLANIFETSADVLLGIELEAKEKVIKEYIDRGDKYLYTGYHQKAAEVFREGLRVYPDSFSLMNGLMTCMWKERNLQDSKEKKCEISKEVISLGEKILTRCTDDSVRHNAIQILCTTYPDVGETEKAVELAKKMPSLYLTSEVLLGNIYTGTKRYETIRSTLFHLIDLLILNMTCNSAPLDDGSKPHSTEELIQIRKKVVRLLETMFEDGNYGFYRQMLGWTYIDMAVFYARLKEYDKAIDSLRIAAEHSIKYDQEYDPNKEYTCLLFKGMKFGPVMHHIPENESMHQLNEMNDPAFDEIRHNKEFIKIEEKLKSYAKLR